MDFQFARVRDTFDQLIHQRGVSHILAYIFVGIPVFVGAVGINELKSIWESLGMHKDFVRGVFIALFFTTPMFVGFAFFFEINATLTLNEFLIGAVAAAFFEELYFRGFLFGQLFRFTRFGFIPSVILGAIIFASGHLWQSHDPSVLFGIFITTFMGAILFAWLYVEWNYNLYVAIFMHFFMNFSWMLFDVSENALGNSYGNLFRYITVALAIAYTVISKLSRGEKLAINRKTLWIKPQPTLDKLELE
ncbi:hypothetical protein SAMN05216480_10357 [Pustulibacterium marinum]|uniref:CAAX prenyl protease 2/Lysostaphin resistance protein A-like domain-containing protein n=2 Tax=Pustulibacterium marinum TaxID=1224947 RepID=A0A1I7G1I2_9FLAO|nr:hypothetical protein SAMN05216480_10357 [Pustulibacterium marinum]